MTWHNRSHRREQEPVGYFSFLADASFSTDDDGRRIFWGWSPVPCAYVVPDPETEARLRTKLTRMNGSTLGTIVLVQPFLMPLFISSVWVFFGYMAALIALAWAATALLFAPEYRTLETSPQRRGFRRHAAKTAERLTLLQLWFGLAGSLAFVAAGLGLSLAGEAPQFVGVVAVAFFGFCAVMYVYMLAHKYRM